MAKFTYSLCVFGTLHYNSILLIRRRNNTKTCSFLKFSLTPCYLSLIALLELKVGSQGLSLTSNTRSDTVVLHTIYMLPVGYLLISHISFHINAVGTQVHLCCISAPKHQSLWEQSVFSSSQSHLPTLSCSLTLSQCILRAWIATCYVSLAYVKHYFLIFCLINDYYTIILFFFFANSFILIDSRLLFLVPYYVLCVLMPGISACPKLFSLSTVVL